MSQPEAIPSIDTADLDEVTGGVTAASPTTNTASSDQVLALLQSIESSIQGLASNNNNNTFMQLLPFIVLSGGFGGFGGRFSFGGGCCPCGCGAPGCCHR
jgi:hypothetical protein